MNDCVPSECGIDTFNHEELDIIELINVSRKVKSSLELYVEESKNVC